MTPATAYPDLSGGEGKDLHKGKTTSREILLRQGADTE